MAGIDLRSPASSPGASSAGLPTNFVSKTSAYTATAGDFVEADTTTGFTVTLPANPTTGTLVAARKVTSDTNTLTIQPSGGGTISGDAADTTTTQWAGAVYEHKGSNVWVRLPLQSSATGVASFQGRTGVITLTKADVTGTGLTNTDVGAAATSHTHAASDLASGTVATARLGSGSASSSTFLRGDQTWATPAGGGSVGIANIAPPSVLQSAVYRPLLAVTGSGTSNYAAGLMEAMPFVPATSVTLNAIGIEVTTAGAASSVIRLGLYADNGSAYPGALITEFTSGTQIDATTTGVKELTISQALTAGTLYWLAYVGQVGIPIVRTTGPLWGPVGATSAANAANAANSRFAWSQSSVTGAMPANFTTTKAPDLNNGGIINIYGRAA